MIGEGEFAAGGEGAAGALARRNIVLGFELLEADLGELLAAAGVFVSAMVVVYFERLHVADFEARVLRLRQAEAGRFEVVVGVSVLAGAEAVAALPFGDAIRTDRIRDSGRGTRCCRLAGRNRLRLRLR